MVLYPSVIIGPSAIGPNPERIIKRNEDFIIDIPKDLIPLKILEKRIYVYIPNTICTAEKNMETGPYPSIGKDISMPIFARTISQVKFRIVFRGNEGISLKW